MGRIHKTTVMAVKHPTTRDLEWAAGFLEGEGHFGPGSGGKGQRVSANQGEPECLQRLADMFGGRVRERMYRNKAFIGTKFEPMNHRLMHSWEITGPLARGVMLTLFTLLSKRRRKQIRDALLGVSVLRSRSSSVSTNIIQVAET